MSFLAVALLATQQPANTVFGLPIGTGVNTLPQQQYLILMAGCTTLLDFLRLASKRQYVGSLRDGCGMSLGNVESGWIATVTVVTIDTRQRVDIFRQARLRHKEPRIAILPELQLAVAKCTSVLLSRQPGTIRRLRSREINRPASAENQKQKQRQSSHLRTSDLRHPAETVFLLG